MILKPPKGHNVGAYGSSIPAYPTGLPRAASTDSHGTPSYVLNITKKMPQRCYPATTHPNLPILLLKDVSARRAGPAHPEALCL